MVTQTAQALSVELHRKLKEEAAHEGMHLEKGR